MRTTKIWQARQLVVRLMFLFLGAFMALQAQSQDFTIKLPEGRTTFEQLFLEIEKQGEVWFAVNLNDFDLKQEVRAPQGEKTLRAVLDELFAGKGHTYRIEGKHIFIVKRPVTEQKPEVTPVPETILRSSIRGGSSGESDEGWVLVSEGRDSTFKALVFEPLTRAILIPQHFTDRTERTTGNYPTWVLKANLLHGLATLTPNLAVEIGTGPRTSLEISGAYNPWNRTTDELDNKKRVHTIIRPEFRYWLCERFNGHFFGVNLFYANYNVSGYKYLSYFKKDQRYEGTTFGLGVTYGYRWEFARNWGLEFNVGVGVALMDYDQFDCIRCSQKTESKSKTYFGPTRAGITLTYTLK